MKRPTPLAVCALAVAVVLGSTACSTTKTYAGRETSLLGGAVEVASKSYQPPEQTSVPVLPADERPGSKLTGQRVSLLWGLLTFCDY